MKLFFLALFTKLSTVSDIKYIHKWNNQLALIIQDGGAQSQMFPFPAAFIAFKTNEIQQLGEGRQMFHVEFDVHILDWQLDSGDGNFEQNLTVYDLTDKVYQAVQKFQPGLTDEAVPVGACIRVSEQEDNDHNGVYHFIQTYRTTYIDQLMVEPVAGVEWADSLGADVISSSLGYNTWDPGVGIDYTLKDLDGKTAKTTRAAAIAVAKGIVVVAAAGNEGNDVWQKVLTPADGKDVIAVGAVDNLGLLAPFSSLGPTADGRIKPDVVALGVGVWTVDLVSPMGYVQRNGTSFSCPLVSGVCALLLQAHPAWTPAQVGRALRETSHDLRPAGPDTLYGWGLVDALAALSVGGDTTLVDEEPELPGKEMDGIVVYPPFPNPSPGEVYFPFKLAADTNVELEVYAPSGELVAIVGPQFFYRTGEYRELLVWGGKNWEYANPGQHLLVGRNSMLSPGVYFYRLDFEGKKTVGKVAIVR